MKVNVNETGRDIQAFCTHRFDFISILNYMRYADEEDMERWAVETVKQTDVGEESVSILRQYGTQVLSIRGAPTFPVCG